MSSRGRIPDNRLWGFHSCCCASFCPLSNWQLETCLLPTVQLTVSTGLTVSSLEVTHSSCFGCRTGPLTFPPHVTVIYVLCAIFKPVCLIKHASVSQIWLGLWSPAESDDVKASPHQLMAQLLLPQCIQSAKIKYRAYDFAATVTSVTCRKLKT